MVGRDLIDWRHPAMPSAAPRSTTPRVAPVGLAFSTTMVLNLVSSRLVVEEDHILADRLASDVQLIRCEVRVWIAYC